MTVGDSVHGEARLRGWLHRIRARDPEALAELYDETSGRLYSLARRILNDPADAEEIVLDVFQQVWKSGHTFDERRGTVSNWLNFLTRNRAIDCLRREARRRNQVPPEQSPEIRSSSPGPEVQSISRQTREILGRAMENLSAGERTAIELAYFQGLTYVQVAEKLGEPVGTIKTRIRSGMRKLRDTVEPMFGV